MKTLSFSRLTGRFVGLFALAMLPPQFASGQSVTVGGLARDFTVVNHATGAPLRLNDYAGKVIVLDFYAYWCPPCQTSSPDLQTNIQNYYTSRNGNQFGVPVQVIPVSIDQSNKPLTDTFNLNARLDLAADDTLGTAWGQFAVIPGNTGTAIPTFVLINAVPNSTTGGVSQWQVLKHQAGYSGAASYRAIIDTIRPGFHSSDYDRTGRINLVKLTRAIELYNTRNATTRTGCYRVDVAGEDGFSPDVIKKMREMGYEFDFVSLKGELREGYGAAIAIDGRRVTAGADPRRAGSAGAVP